MNDSLRQSPSLGFDGMVSPCQLDGRSVVAISGRIKERE